MSPRATYRIQFQKDFGFDQAVGVVSYLARLGISHLYASPWLKARPGSLHGYDIVDHGALNPELGDGDSFGRLRAALESKGLKQILDLVPNHMGVGGSDNPLWLDVLEWGADSTYGGWFDIEWNSDRRYLENKLLVPFLANQYGVELENGKLILKFDDVSGTFAVWAYDTHKLPICPLHYARILGRGSEELERFGDAFDNLPELHPHMVSRAADLKSDLARAAQARPELREAIDAVIARFNGTPQAPESWISLNELIQEQHWRAAHYLVAGDDINYRRFFNVNDLAGMRIELAEVFESTHRFVWELMRDGALDGLRVDHVDGLLDPKEYLERLRAASPASCYLVVEKILSRYETLPESWPVDGTTGYDFTNQVLGILIDPAGDEPLTRAYVEFTGETRSFEQIVRASKIRITEHEMASELDTLAGHAARIARQNPRTADFTHNILRRAIQEIVACFPVYRTYVDSLGKPSEADRRYLDWALGQARAHQRDVDASVFDFLAGLLSGDLVKEAHSGFSRHAVLRFAMKLQQYSGPVMAKGLEDTAFYRYHRMIALNEVGGDPGQFGIPMSTFHRANAHRAKHWPHTMLATSTHDTKRGEDARARLAVLSEIPEEWTRQVQTWTRILRARAGDLEGTAPPDRNDEYLFYQMLLGSWPAELTGVAEPDPETLINFAVRLKDTMRKSIREAKIHSTWAAPNAAYEDAVLLFVDNALDPERSRTFLSAFLPFQERIARLGVANSLTQTVLKLTLPGVPDIYQGSELWDLSMVDPDNRRPVDYSLRCAMLERCLNAPQPRLRDLLENWQDGAAKLATIARLLHFRKANVELFQTGSYDPLAVNGPRADQVCTFVRRHEVQSLIVAAARFPAALDRDPDWNGTTIRLPDETIEIRWTDLLTGVILYPEDHSLPAQTVFQELPAAVLIPS